MSFATPPVFTVGQKVTAAQMNVLSEDVAFIGRSNLSRIHRTAGSPQSIATATWSDITFHTEATDSLNGFAGPDTLITLPWTGDYLVIAKIVWAAAGASTGVRHVQMYSSNTTNESLWSPETLVTIPGSTVETGHPAISDTATHQAGEQLGVRVYQNSGSSLNVVRAQLSVVYLGHFGA